MIITKTLLFTTFTFITAPAFAQTLLTLDSCRTMALAENKHLLAGEKEKEAATYEHYAAKTNYLPRLKATGAYIRNSREQHLLSESTRTKLNNLGNETAEPLQQLAQTVARLHPELSDNLTSISSNLIGQLNNIGQNITNTFRTDTKNMFVGALTLTQPIYMGGKIRAYDKITGYAKEIAEQQYRADKQEVILEVDEAYWQIVSLANKKKLAESYVELMQRMDSDITKMIKTGVATHANGLSVSVRLNEAEMALTKVENGLSLARMLLCCICGMPLNSSFKLADEDDITENITQTDHSFDINTAMTQRPELRSLELMSEIYNKKIQLAHAEFLPQIALMGNYLLTNPSVYNGFEKKLKGMFNIGIMVTAPLFQWGEEKYKIRAAKAKAAVAKYQLTEAQDKIELQVNQASFRVSEANKTLKNALKNCERAEENLRTADVGFKAGVIPTSDMLEAQTAWISAQSEKVDAAINVRLTQIYLQKSLGVLK